MHLKKWNYLLSQGMDFDSIVARVVYLSLLSDIAGKLAKQALAQRGCRVGREGIDQILEL